MSYEPYRNHRNEAILAADPLELVVMLYSELKVSIGRARRCLRDGDVSGRASATSLALEILAELASSLDRQRGGEIAGKLSGLYEFLSARLQDGNLRQADEPYAEAECVVDTLHEAWGALHSRARTDRFGTTDGEVCAEGRPALAVCG
jgi:flagellar protein FliS